MSSASTEIPRRFGRVDAHDTGAHTGYIFDAHDEKQSRLFSLCSETVNLKNSAVVYVAGKQGIKGIRLSLIDTGFDVAFYQKTKRIKIVDSEEWFLTTDRKPQFKSLERLYDDVVRELEESTSAGYAGVLLIFETDMLVRKGYLQKYLEFDEMMNKRIENMKVSVLCAFDRRELTAAGVKDPAALVSSLHSHLL